MGVTPVPDFRIPPQVIVSHVVSTHPGFLAVHHDHLSVVSEVDLEAVAGALTCVEGGGLDSSVPKLLQV